MSERPPRDGDDLWSDVIDQVSDALDEADVKDGTTRDALLDGVRQALESMGSTLDMEVELVTDGDLIAGAELIIENDAMEPDPTVSVMEGGRADADPRTPGDKPDLRVADLPEDGPSEEILVSPPESPFVAQVKVLRTPPRMPGHPEAIPGLGRAGWIQVAGDAETDAAWQTLYQGKRSRLYRIGCTQGTLDITLDGTQVERLRAGQSIDVEGCKVRVSATEGEQGRGGYAWISAPEGEE